MQIATSTNSKGSETVTITLRDGDVFQVRETSDGEFLAFFPPARPPHSIEQTNDVVKSFGPATRLRA